LLRRGHRVVVHARDKAKAAATSEALRDATAVLLGDLSSLEETKALAGEADGFGPFDAVVHNAGVGGSSHRRLTRDGLEEIFQVNALAPYVLTAMMKPPKRLVYLSSGLQASGTGELRDLQHERGRFDGMRAYSDSKLWDVVLAFAVSRHWPSVLSNAVDPGWVKTRMGGRGAPDSIESGAGTPVWLATSNEPAAMVSGRFFYGRRERRAHPAAYDESLQERFLEVCRSLSGVALGSSGP